MTPTARMNHSILSIPTFHVCSIPCSHLDFLRSGPLINTLLLLGVSRPWWQLKPFQGAKPRNRLKRFFPRLQRPHTQLKQGVNERTGRPEESKMRAHSTIPFCDHSLYSSRMQIERDARIYVADQPAMAGNINSRISL